MNSIPVQLAFDKSYTHKPFHPVRQGIIGEEVFAMEWALYASSLDEESLNRFDERVTKFEVLLSPISYRYRLTQRAATIAASVVTWLGSSVGAAFLENATSGFFNIGKIGTSLPEIQTRYLTAWHFANLRESHRNSGVTLLEILLSEKPAPGMFIPTSEYSDLSAADLEVAQCVMRWLGTEEGQNFIKICEFKIHMKQAKDNSSNEYSNISF